MSKKKKAVLFFSIIVLMCAYIGWSFYVSEPKYIDNITSKKLEKYDYIAIPYWDFETSKQQAATAIVIQVDGTRALIKTQKYNDELRDIVIEEHNYRIIGKATVYHKINTYVGFNVMLISQVFIFILLIIIAVTEFNLLSDLLK